ncbi:transposase [Streptomyces sparsogenes DSM 40356]|uniref:Transposase n=1 Tax=Streptomyces sparsogenes DSM 40356 TaxID=1331668 RepID=A0A1R1SEF7_9ACTN|nr:transposase [Streptomyces sparsogenes DSM 40356]
MSLEPRPAPARSGCCRSVERKNCWQLAEQAGHARPEPMQRLLCYVRWDAESVRDEVRAYAAEHLGADGRVLVADETGFLKKGRSSAGGQRQDTSTADPRRRRRSPPPAHPAQPVHRRTRLLPVLVTPRGAPVRTGPRRRFPVERRGVLPGRQGPSRARPLRGPHLGLLAPAHHARHARPAFLTALAAYGAPNGPSMRTTPSGRRGGTCGNRGPTLLGSYRRIGEGP